MCKYIYLCLYRSRINRLNRYRLSSVCFRRRGASQLPVQGCENPDRREPVQAVRCVHGGAGSVCADSYAYISSKNLASSLCLYIYESAERSERFSCVRKRRADWNWPPSSCLSNGKRSARIWRERSTSCADCTIRESFSCSMRTTTVERSPAYWSCKCIA